MSIFGMAVIEHPLLKDSTPVLQVSDDCPMTDEGRAFMNKFLLETFGMTKSFYVMNNRIYASPDSVARLRLAIQRQGLNHDH